MFICYELVFVNRFVLYRVANFCPDRNIDRKPGNALVFPWSTVYFVLIPKYPVLDLANTNVYYQ